MQISTLFILQIINITIAIIFLLLFLYRLHYLRHFSQTDKYLSKSSIMPDYYPKIRILFAVLYVVLSLALLGYNIAAKEYPSDGSRYLFAGGGGESINSLVLLLQLIVLRQELKKQRPYTPTHMIYFSYLVLISIVRFGLTLAGLITKQNDEQVIDLILATCLMVDSCIQLGYWIAKKQSLPEFQANKYFSFDEFKVQSNRQLINRLDLSNRLEQKSVEQDFPYIKATVNVQNSKFRVILEVLASNNVLPPNFDTTDIEKINVEPSNLKDKNISQVLKSSVEIRRSSAAPKTYRNSKRSFHMQIISEHFYNLQQIKELYVLCGRFPLKKQIIFNDMSLREIAKNLQQYLDEVFDNKRYYQSFLLKFLHIDGELVKIYEQKTKGFQDIMTVDRMSAKSEVYTQYNKFSSISHHDKNAIYLSIQVYKQLWIEDHYQFYMKVHVKQNDTISYPMRRFSEFEELDNQLKIILVQKSKMSSHVYQLPQLPKKHLFYLDQEKINHRRIQLQLYLRKLCNDYTIVEIVQVRELILRFLNLHSKIIHINPVYEQNFYDNVKVVKGNTSKALINNDYVTFYEFKLFRQGIEIRSINKRFSDFVVLNEDIQRWMNNIQIYYKSIQFPEKHLYKSEMHRHEKLRNYLQAIISVKESYQIYSLNVFINISGNNELSDDTFFSAISFVKSKGKESSIDFNYNDVGIKPFVISEQKNYELEMEQAQPDFCYSIDGKRMSVLIEELGKDD